MECDKNGRNFGTFLKEAKNRFWRMKGKILNWDNIMNLFFGDGVINPYHVHKPSYFAKTALFGGSCVAVTLMWLALRTYKSGAYNVNEPSTQYEPREIEKITRHPYFVGYVLNSIICCLTSSNTVGFLFHFLYGLFAIVGPIIQDRKLKYNRKNFDQYLEQTSHVPFLAILQGKQKIFPEDIPYSSILIALAWNVGMFYWKGFHVIQFNPAITVAAAGLLETFYIK